MRACGKPPHVMLRADYHRLIVADVAGTVVRLTARTLARRTSDV